MNKVMGFEKYGIKSLSPTMISTWDTAPATLILRRVFGVKFESNAKMWRGDAVEAGVDRLLGGVDMDLAKSFAEGVFLDRSQGEVSDEIDAEFSKIGPTLEQGLAVIDDLSPGQVLASQLAVDGWFDGISAPFWGKMDFVFEDGPIWELKTTDRIPSKIESVSLSHRWQAAVYATFRKTPVTLIYISAKKYNTFTVEPDDPCLKSLQHTARAMDRMLDSHDEGLDLLASLPLNADSFYWDEGMLEAYEGAICGELPPLKGTGTEALHEKGVITFGKHAGMHITDVPDSYLDWLLDPKLSNGDVFEVPEALQNAIRHMREVGQ